MKHPKELSIKDFTYLLPDSRIAAHPLQQRDSSKLLVYKNGIITEDIYRNIANYLPSDSFMVFNNTRVVEARLLFRKPSGGVIEIFCLEPDNSYPDITTALSARGIVRWHCLVGGASKWKHGQVLEKKLSGNDHDVFLKARYIEKKTDSFLIELSWNDDRLSFAEILHAAGAIPLPPYIKREAEPADAERYQTVYAKTEGSVAAPTAGLHFTTGLLESLEEKNISRDFLTLHVGAGTFKPVKSETMQEYEMHAEYIEVSRRFLEKLIARLDRPVIAVGTTSLRTLESLYWMGLQAASHKHAIDDRSSVTDLFVKQWEPYERDGPEPTTKDSLLHLLDWMSKREMELLIAKTQIIIAPGYRTRIANALVTNFHQPQSTLLLLVAALIGDDWKKIYDYALKNNFRFLSYGDGSLLWFD